MAAEDGGGAEEESANNNNKVKFLCSHGGKILPRATEGQLKYVGGETRAVSVPRHINFSELMKKLATLSDGGDIILKYQVMLEDLDALVTVKTDEDLHHMIDEYDRHESRGTAKLRAFLFPANPIITENHTTPTDPHTRYVDAVNGIVRPGIVRAAAAGLKLPPTTRSSSPLRVSSACSSPRSPDSCNIDYRVTNHETVPQSRIGGMHRVHSSPSVSSLNQTPPLQHNNHHIIHLHHHQNYQQLHRLGHQSPTGPPPERLFSVGSVGRSDSMKYQVISGSNNCYPVSGYNRGITSSCSNDYYCTCNSKAARPFAKGSS